MNIENRPFHKSPGDFLYHNFKFFWTFTSFFLKFKLKYAKSWLLFSITLSHIYIAMPLSLAIGICKTPGKINRKLFSSFSWFVVYRDWNRWSDEGFTFLESNVSISCVYLLSQMLFSLPDMYNCYLVHYRWQYVPYKKLI